MTAAVRLLLACLLVAPAAGAAHYTFYHDPAGTRAFHPAMATFEGNDAGAPTHGNQNGPAGEERRAIPNASDVPRRFRGLEDTLVGNGTMPGIPGVPILDHQMYGSAVETGHLVPYSYYASRETGAPRTTPTSMHALWYGYWNDTNGDGVIADEWCEAGLVCSGTDEFVWRGANTGEDLAAYLYVFPGDYDPSRGTGGRGFTGLDPSAWGGFCALYRDDNPGCISPRPDDAYTDYTDPRAPGQEGNQRWAAGDGGGQWTAEEFLLVSQHTVSVAGPKSTVREPWPSREEARVDGQPEEGIQRDYDWYDSLADATVEALYLDHMRIARDCWNDFHWFWTTCAPPLPDPVWWPWFEACPKAACYSPTEHAHLEAVGPPGASQKAWATAYFTNVVPVWATTPTREFTDHNCGRVGLAPGTCPVLPAQGFYGEMPTYSYGAQPFSSAVPPGIVRVTLVAWLWDDANGDGYIGSPSSQRLAMYEAGLLATPNDGVCARRDWAPNCELEFQNRGYADTATTVRPGDAGWPPGAFVLRDYDRFYEFAPAGPGPAGPEFSTSLLGSEPAELRHDPERCRSPNANVCRSIDALVLPSGSGTLLRGESPVTVAWTEGAASFQVAFAGQFEARL